MSSNPNIRYFVAIDEDEKTLVIGLDRREVVSAWSMAKLNPVIGIEATPQCLLMLRYSLSKPILVLGSMEQVAAQLGWPTPPKLEDVAPEEN